MIQKNNGKKKKNKRQCDIKNAIHYGVKICNDNAGETICNNCGTILEEKTMLTSTSLYSGANGSLSSHDSKGSNISDRTSEILDSHHSKHSGNGNTVLIGKKDHNGNKISTEMKQSLDRLHRFGSIQRTRANDAERLQINGLAKILTISSQLHLPDFVQVEAAQLYKEMQKMRLIQGRTTSGVATACIYHICKKADIPITMAETAKTAGIEVKKLFQILREILKIVESMPSSSSSSSSGINDDKKKNNHDDNHDDNNNDNNRNSSDDSNYSRYILHVPKITSKIKLPQRITNDAISLIKRQDIVNTLSGKSPIVIAACAIYCVVINDSRYDDDYNSITQDSIADAARITTVSIRNHYRKFVV